MIVVRNQVTASQAFRACHNAGLTLKQGIEQGLFKLSPGWGWTIPDMVSALQDQHPEIVEMSGEITATAQEE